MGGDVEEYIAQYTDLRWNEQLAWSLSEKLETLSQHEREVVLIRLANELEDYLDLGILFCGLKKRTQAGYRASAENILCDIARKLGFPQLAEALKTEFEKAEIAGEQNRFKTIRSRDFSFFEPSLSYKRLTEVLSKQLNERANRTKDSL